MKRCLSWILIAVLLFSCLWMCTACDNEEAYDLSDKIQEKLAAYQNDLTEASETLRTPEAVCDYLCSWAKARDIRYTVDEQQNVILQIPAAKGYEKADPTAVLCGYDAHQFASCTDPIAMAMYLAKNHEGTGPLTVIFTADTGHNFAGVRQLSDDYITDATKVFCLNHGERNSWSYHTGGRSSYRFTGAADYTAPTGEKAYRIAISGLPGGMPGARISSYPNPIKELGDLLAYFKTNALIFELADVSGGSSGNLYPCSVSATVVIDEDDVEKFQTRMDTAIETFMDQHSGFLADCPDAAYTYEEVKLPRRVLTSDSLNNFVSVLYTLLNGVYYADESEEMISFTNIGALSCGEDAITISAVANSLSPSNLREIDTAYQTICGLSGFRYRRTGSQEVYTGDGDAPLCAAVAAAFQLYSGKEIEWKSYVPATGLSYLHQLNDKAELVNVAVNQDRLERYTGTLVTYLQELPHEEAE